MGPWLGYQLDLEPLPLPEGGLSGPNATIAMQRPYLDLLLRLEAALRAAVSTNLHTQLSLSLHQSRVCQRGASLLYTPSRCWSLPAILARAGRPRARRLGGRLRPAVQPHELGVLHEGRALPGHRRPALRYGIV
jgi:hypothetical protein